MTKIFESRRILDSMSKYEPPTQESADAEFQLVQAMALVEIAETLHYMAEIMVASMGTTGVRFEPDPVKES